MGWCDLSYQKKGAIIGASIAIIAFAIIHIPEAVFLDSFFTESDNMVNEIHIVALLFVIIVTYAAFVGQLIGKIMDKLKKPIC